MEEAALGRKYKQTLNKVMFPLSNALKKEDIDIIMLLQV